MREICIEEGEGYVDVRVGGQWIASVSTYDNLDDDVKVTVRNQYAPEVDGIDTYLNIDIMETQPQ